ncbi:MAG: RidA family protein [Alphaproteobacteria bacterium]|nr:RidA family protein [Alphaproteobacteria bacterium]
MNKAHNPPAIAQPIGGTYSHGLEVPANARTLYIAGQVGLAPDGKLGATLEDQAEQAWRNIEAILASASMAPTDLVKIVTYVIDPRYIQGAREVRARHLGTHRPASTLVVISGLADPKMLIEIEGVAAKA